MVLAQVAQKGVCFPAAQNDALGVCISFVVEAVLAMVSLAIHVLDGIDDSRDGLRLSIYCFLCVLASLAVVVRQYRAILIHRREVWASETLSHQSTVTGLVLHRYRISLSVSGSL